MSIVTKGCLKVGGRAEISTRESEFIERKFDDVLLFFSGSWWGQACLKR